MRFNFNDPFWRGWPMELWDISKKKFETCSNNFKKITNFFGIVILIFTPKKFILLPILDLLVYKMGDQILQEGWILLTILKTENLQWGPKKKNFTQSGSNLTEVNFDIKYEGHQNCLKTCFMKILSVYNDLHIRRKSCPCQVWTSLCQVLFFL